MRLAVIGAGAWGTALAIAMSASHRVSLWCRTADEAEQLQRDQENRRYLPGIKFGNAIHLTHFEDPPEDPFELSLIAVPVAGLRGTLKALREHQREAGCVWACKGFEQGSGKLPHEVAAEELAPGIHCAALSGPSFAADVAKGLPTAVTLASGNEDFAVSTSRQLHTGRLRVYSSSDLIGVEIGGAVKNVIAIAAGICDGLHLGDSARAALVTRGLAEITRLGLRLGGRLETFMGLSGLGDLSLTCAGNLSRNRRVGLMLATGKPLAEVLSELGHVAEGVNTAREVRQMARRLELDMPITQSVVSVLDGDVSAAQAVDALLQRDPKPEDLG